MPKSQKTASLKAQLEKFQAKGAVNYHDLFFKSFYSDPVFALELLQLIFHREEFKAYDWSRLKTEKDTLKEKRADLVFSVPLKLEPKSRVKIFILLEHKSYYDSDLFSQMLYYQTLLHEESLKSGGPASPVIPVVFYHGKTPWKWSKTFQEDAYKGFLSKIPVRSRKNMLNYEIKLLDAHDPKLKGVFRNKSVKSYGALYLLKEIWGLKLSRADLKRVLSHFGNFSGGGHRQSKLIGSVSDYLKAVFKAGEEFKKIWQKVEQELLEQGVFKKGGYMDIIQYMKEREQMKGLRRGLRKGRQEGIEKGLEKGKKEIILNMLEAKTNMTFISEVTGWPVKEIKKLKNRT